VDIGSIQVTGLLQLTCILGLGNDVPRAGVTRAPISVLKVKVKVKVRVVQLQTDGRIICRHWADVCFECLMVIQGRPLKHVSHTQESFWDQFCIVSF